MLVQNLRLAWPRGDAHVAHRTVELLIGRIITDDHFREAFLRAPEATLRRLAEQGLDLSRIEVAALANTSPDVWVHAASTIDERLRRSGSAVDAAR